MLVLVSLEMLLYIACSGSIRKLNQSPVPSKAHRSLLAIAEELGTVPVQLVKLKVVLTIQDWFWNTRRALMSLLKAMVCVDVSYFKKKWQVVDFNHGVAVEELICLATWKEGSTRYLVGKVTQGNRRPLTSDEDQYRCFIYQRDVEANKVVYNIAQSADATCNGLQSAFEGSKTMKFKTGKLKPSTG